MLAIFFCIFERLLTQNPTNQDSRLVIFPDHMEEGFLLIFLHIFWRMNFLQSFQELTKFWMVRLCPDVSDVIHVNKYR